jgi:hypothetical protein
MKNKKCESKICVKQDSGDGVSLCFTCGFYSNNHVEINSQEYWEIVNALPQLYNEISYIDEDNKVWIPKVLNEYDKGMLFIDGTNEDDWEWVFAPAISIKEEEKTKFPIKGKFGEFHTYRIDYTQAEKLGKKGFLLGIGKLGLL